MRQVLSAAILVAIVVAPFGGLATNAAAFHPEPDRANVIEAPIVPAYAQCGTGNVCVGPFQHRKLDPALPPPDCAALSSNMTSCANQDGCRPACTPAVESNPVCRYGPNGHGKVKVTAKSGDLSVDIKMYDVECAPGYALGVIGSSRLTLDGCAGAACTLVDFDKLTTFHAWMWCDPATSRVPGQCRQRIRSVNEALRLAKPGLYHKDDQFRRYASQGLEIFKSGFWPCQMSQDGKTCDGQKPSFFAGVIAQGDGATDTSPLTRTSKQASAYVVVNYKACPSSATFADWWDVRACPAVPADDQCTDLASGRGTVTVRPGDVSLSVVVAGSSCPSGTILCLSSSTQVTTDHENCGDTKCTVRLVDDDPVGLANWRTNPPVTPRLTPGSGCCQVDESGGCIISTSVAQLSPGLIKPGATSEGAFFRGGLQRVDPMTGDPADVDPAYLVGLYVP